MPGAPVHFYIFFFYLVFLYIYIYFFLLFSLLLPSGAIVAFRAVSGKIIETDAAIDIHGCERYSVMKEIVRCPDLNSHLTLSKIK